MNKSESKGDALRGKLSGASGAPDISKPDAVRKTMAKSDRGQLNRDAVKTNRPTASKASMPKASAAKKNAVKKPSASKAPVKKASIPKSVTKPKATRKSSAGPKARKASNRGKKAGGKMKKRRG